MVEQGAVDIVWPVSVLPEEALSGAARQVCFAAPEVHCRRCAATGWAGAQHCPVCNGTAVESIARVVELRIPPGVDEGQRLRVARGGSRGSDGTPADVYLECCIAWHSAPWF